MKALLCELLFACVMAAPGPRTADELAYGQLLYAYFQEDYSGALVEALIAEQRGTLADDPARFALARGSLAFAEGLHRMSDAAFATLDPAALDDVDRMRLAFHRARAEYRAGDLPAMSAHLDEIRFEPGWFGRQRQHPEVGFMRAEAAIAAGDFAGAARQLDMLPEDDDHLGYGLFNLAVAERSAGDARAAHATLARLADLQLQTPAGRDLVRRGRLAWAVTTAETGDPLEAQDVLDRLPAGGHYRDRALAVYGQLAVDRADHRLAARIWMTLLEDAEWGQGRARAELGLPMALDALDARERALGAWTAAAGRLEARLTDLQRLRGSSSGADWPGRVMSAHLETGRDQPDLVPPDIAETFGSRAWLAWLAREDVSALIAQWRDLRRMQDWLHGLPTRLAALEEVKQERRRRSAEARGRLGDQALHTRRTELAQRIERIDMAIAALADPARPLDAELAAALLDQGQQKRLARIESLGAALAATAPAERAEELARRIARLRGVVLWSVAETRSTRTRDLVRALAETRDQLAEVDRRIARIERAESELEAGVEVDFLALSQRTAALAEAVTDQLAARETALAEAFREAVDGELQQVEQHLLTARIAIARATDQLAAAPAAGEPGS